MREARNVLNSSKVRVPSKMATLPTCMWLVGVSKYKKDASRPDRGCMGSSLGGGGLVFSGKAIGLF